MIKTFCDRCRKEITGERHGAIHGIGDADADGCGTNTDCFDIVCDECFDAWRAWMHIEAKCLDCGLDYADFPMDLLLPRWQWLMIHPSDGGLLCAACMVKRAARIPSATAMHAVIGIAPPASATAGDPSAEGAS